MGKVISTIEEVREYTQKEYWESGKTDGVSGYENYSMDWQWSDKFVKHFNQVFDTRAGKFLDLGCAYGRIVASMLKVGVDAYGIDLSDYAINAGHKAYAPLVGKTKQGSCHDLSKHENESFNVIHSNQVFEHVPADCCDQLAAETYRVANPGAVLWAGLVFDVASEYQPQGYNSEDPDKTHINLRPKVWWDEKFLAAGWVLNEEDDNRFRAIRDEVDSYSFFEDYGWHSICYKKTY